MKRFIDCVIPFRTCNLRCPYCYITHTKSFGEKLPVFPYSAEHIGRSLSAERLGGISLINLCGEGETLLPPEVGDCAGDSGAGALCDGGDKWDSVQAV